MKAEDLDKIDFNALYDSVPEGAACFSCVYMAGGTFSPDGYTARCVLGHNWGGCCKMVSKPCHFYEEDKIRIGDNRRASTRRG